MADLNETAMAVQSAKEGSDEQTALVRALFTVGLLSFETTRLVLEVRLDCPKELYEPYDPDKIRAVDLTLVTGRLLSVESGRGLLSSVGTNEGANNA